MSRAVVEQLLDIRDGVSVAKHLIVGIYMAAQAPMVSSNERAALCAVCDIAREQLENVERTLDALIADEPSR